MDILEELWLGQVAPIERAFPKTDGYRKALREVEEKRQALEEMRSWKGENILAAYSDAEIRVQDYAERGAFALGFRLGAKLILAIQDKE